LITNALWLQRQKSRSSRAGALVPHGGSRKALLHNAGDGGETSSSRWLW
jgi:hypothetical protein